MTKVLKIALRNLSRYRRRTLLTLLLITLGLTFVLLFVSVTGSFKKLMIGQITDSFLGDVQIHRKGYVASIDNLPLHLNIKPEEAQKIRDLLDNTADVVSYSERIKFGGMFSNFQQTSNIRVNGVYPEKEFATCPLLPARMVKGKRAVSALAPGKILVPELLARGLEIKIGDTVVVIATNRDGSVNGKTFEVSGILESVSGPGGRDGYIHILDAMEILRLEKLEVSEFAVNVREFHRVNELAADLWAKLSGMVNKQGKPRFEVHSWDRLSPFARVAQMIDLMTFFVKLMLIAIVLISILNVMIMAVYERVREIGTIAAIGTKPGRIMSLFLMEGLALGVSGSMMGTLLSVLTIWILNLSRITFSFGRQVGLVLAPTISAGEVVTACLLVIVIAVVASLQPAYMASKMEPVEALRHV